MKNIIITGGGFVNKGAQAMTFISVSELRKRFPNHEIYLFSPTDLGKGEKELSKYNFKVFGWFPIKFAKAQKNPILHFICSIKNRQELKKAEAIYKNCDLIIDVSGYSLGSNWSYKINSDFLDIIEFAKGFNIPIYLMPQSFGPFDYCDEKGYEIDKRTKSLFPYVKTVFTREQEGYDALKNRYGLSNLKMAKDLVLSSSIEKYDVYNQGVVIDIPKIKQNSVVIIPNSKTIEFGDVDKILEAYKSSIELLFKHNKNVYLISHSSMDSVYCQRIKEMFKDDERLVYLDEDLSCIQFNEIVKKIDFVIASRFHSIVHSYKNGTPCIAIGWATKYHDLLTEFSQQGFMFDSRYGIDEVKLLKDIEYLIENFEVEKEKIISHLPEVQKENVFDELSF